MRLYLSAISLMALIAGATVAWSCSGGTGAEPSPPAATPSPTTAQAATPTPAEDAGAGDEKDDSHAQDQPGVIEIAPGQPMEIPPGKGENYATFEMHWGFTDQLEVAEDAPEFWLPMNGRISIDDGDPSTVEGIHIISALLFEDSGSLASGTDDFVTVPQDQGWTVTGTGYFYPWVSWESATTTDWDGMAVSLRWDPGTDPTVTVQAGDWSASVSATQLGTLASVQPTGPAGQTLEIGEFFNLTWKVYDLALTWGYNPEADQSPDTLYMTNEWNGSVTVDTGALYVMKTQNMEAGSSQQAMPDAIAPRGELDATVSFSSVTSDVTNKQGAIDGIGVNIIAPRGSRPVLTVRLNGDTEQVQLPRRFRDVVRDFSLDSDGHFLQGHLHWCWWKTPDAGHP